MKSNIFKTWKVNHKTKIITVKSMCQVKERVWGLRRSNLFLNKILKWLKKINLQQVVELKLEDTTSQKFDDEVKEKKVELIIEDPIYRNKEVVIIENIL